MFRLGHTRRRVEQLAARRAHNPEVAGSSPAPATSYAAGHWSAVFLCRREAAIAAVYHWDSRRRDRGDPDRPCDTEILRKGLKKALVDILCVISSLFAQTVPLPSLQLSDDLPDLVPLVQLIGNVLVDNGGYQCLVGEPRLRRSLLRKLHVCPGTPQADCLILACP